MGVKIKKLVNQLRIRFIIFFGKYKSSIKISKPNFTNNTEVYVTLNVPEMTISKGSGIFKFNRIAYRKLNNNEGEFIEFWCINPTSWIAVIRLMDSGSRGSFDITSGKVIEISDFPSYRYYLNKLIQNI